jgi:ABC-2 type transport system permease protein
LVSGVYYDVSVLPAWLRPFSVVSPATYTLRAMRAAVLDGVGLAALGDELLILVVSGVVLIPLGFACFVLGERWAKKTGKLKIEG